MAGAGLDGGGPGIEAAPGAGQRGVWPALARQAPPLPPLPPRRSPSQEGRKQPGRGESKKAAVPERSCQARADAGREEPPHRSSSRREPSLLAMSQSRHRAEARPLEREDSGTFRSASGPSGRGREQWAAAAGAGSRLSRGMLGKAPSRGWGRRGARPRPSVVPGGAGCAEGAGAARLDRCCAWSEGAEPCSWRPRIRVLCCACPLSPRSPLPRGDRCAQAFPAVALAIGKPGRFSGHRWWQSS